MYFLSVFFFYRIKSQISTRSKAPHRPAVCRSVGRGRCIIALLFKPNTLPANSAVNHPDTWVPAERAVHRGGLFPLLKQSTILPFVALYIRRCPKQKKSTDAMRSRKGYQTQSMTHGLTRCSLYRLFENTCPYAKNSTKTAVASA
jgi:hypothetical protein